MGPEIRLNLMHYLGDVLDEPYSPMKHDCLTFTNKCWEIMYGHKWSPDWLGNYYEADEAKIRILTIPQLRAKFGFQDLPPAIDSLEGLERISLPSSGYLGFGHLVIRKSSRTIIGYAMGISLGRSLVYLGLKGLLYHNPDYHDFAWQKTEAEIKNGNV